MCVGVFLYRIVVYVCRCIRDVDYCRCIRSAGNSRQYRTGISINTGNNSLQLHRQLLCMCVDVFLYRIVVYVCRYIRDVEYCRCIRSAGNSRQYRTVNSVNTGNNSLQLRKDLRCMYEGVFLWKIVVYVCRCVRSGENYD